MDEKEKPGEGKPDKHETPPEAQKPQQPAQQQTDPDKPQEQKEVKTSSSSPELPKTQQPSLVGKAPEEGKRKFPSPPKSFVIAAATIILTIALGVAIALSLGRITQRAPKGQSTSEPETPQETIQPAQRLPVQQASPSADEGTPSSSFQGLLDVEPPEEVTPPGPRVATSPALPLQQ